MTGARSPSTIDLADAAAQAVRELNHRTQHRSALNGPAQLDRIVAELAVMVAGRSGSYFPDWLLERRTRAERATSYLLGVSTRRVEKLVQALGVTLLSKSQVSIMARKLDEQVEAFRTPHWTGAVHVRGGRRAGPQGPRGRPRRSGARPARDRRTATGIGRSSAWT